MAATPDTPDYEVAATYFIPESTRDNYLQMARDTAAESGGTSKAAMAKLAKDFASKHEVDPTGGWQYLAEWAKTADPDESVGPSSLALATARAVEGARRDPDSFLQGNSQVLEAATEEKIARDQAPVNQASDTGTVANPKPTVAKGPTQSGV